MKHRCTYLVTFITLSLTLNVYAQDLNVREAASPATKAKMNRALAGARSQAAKVEDINLNRKTVNMDCQPLEIGVDEEDGEKKLNRRKKVGSQKEPVIVIPGDVINICK